MSSEKDDLWNRNQRRITERVEQSRVKAEFDKDTEQLRKDLEEADMGTHMYFAVLRSALTAMNAEERAMQLRKLMQELDVMREEACVIPPQKPIQFASNVRNITVERSYTDVLRAATLISNRTPWIEQPAIAPDAHKYIDKLFEICKILGITIKPHV